MVERLDESGCLRLLSAACRAAGVYRHNIRPRDQRAGAAAGPFGR